MRPISESTARVAAKNFSRKYIALGRIVNEWEQIMGAEFAGKTQPLKINYRKATRNKEQTATLDIATSAAQATVLPYQKDVILERINQVFGNQWITDIKFVTSNILETPITRKKTITPLTQAEKNYLSEVLDDIEDNEIKEKLENLGKSMLTDQKS